MTIKQIKKLRKNPPGLWVGLGPSEFEDLPGLGCFLSKRDPPGRSVQPGPAGYYCSTAVTGWSKTDPDPVGPVN